MRFMHIFFAWDNAEQVAIYTFHQTKLGHFYASPKISASMYDSAFVGDETGRK